MLVTVKVYEYVSLFFGSVVTVTAEPLPIQDHLVQLAGGILQPWIGDVTHDAFQDDNDIYLRLYLTVSHSWDSNECMGHFS